MKEITVLDATRKTLEYRSFKHPLSHKLRTMAPCKPQEPDTKQYLFQRPDRISFLLDDIKCKKAATKKIMSLNVPKRQIATKINSQPKICRKQLMRKQPKLEAIFEISENTFNDISDQNKDSNAVLYYMQNSLKDQKNLLLSNETSLLDNSQLWSSENPEQELSKLQQVLSVEFENSTSYNCL